ncbi:MAG TPA: PQQ-dependent sugar dehydrogenase [Candidatus Polarisedimenticolia bacterium]|jgi:glucose/arabinose dehydrogenase
MRLGGARVMAAGAMLALALLSDPEGAFADCAGVPPVSNTTLTTVAVATGLAGRPLFVTAPPGDRDRLFIVEQNGTIRIKRRGEPVGQNTLFLDLTSRVQASTSLNEMGLLGLAFDPDHATNGYFYVNYTEGALGGPWFTVVARYSLTAGDPNSGDFGSETRLLRFLQPQSNHNGGQLTFGPDGFLYIATGDGGGGGDSGTGHATCGNGQSLGTLLGKMLRVDVRGIDPLSRVPDCGGGPSGYRIPSDNPVNDGTGGGCDEIWDYGLRNPWRSSFDALTGDLYIADVGQSCWEEVDYEPGGSAGGVNYGWRQMEGKQCFRSGTPINCDPNGVACSGVPNCDDPALIQPILDYPHSGGACSVTGGYVYRGCSMPLFAGIYFYGDYCAGWVKSFRVVGGVPTEELDRTGELGLGTSLVNSLTSFGVDDEGEIHIIDRDGTILKVVPPFTDLEVSADGSATPFTLAPATWTWENLFYSTGHPVSAYRVYRGAPGGTFTCVLASAAPQWPGGDTAAPGPGQLFAYIVTAVNPSGQQTRTGDPPRTLSPAACP